MYESIRIAPSILSANFMDLTSAIKLMEEAHVGFVHIDVMDGHFVPNITMGVPITAQIAPVTDIPLDVHLMVSNPLTQIPWFLDAGASMISFHIEAVTDDEVMQAIDMIHDHGRCVALAFKPDSDIDRVEPYIDMLDMVLVMSVFPGFSGQSYIEGSEDRVSRVVEIARKHDVNPLIEVDGGIGCSTVGKVARSGADVFVCGNAFFKSEDPIIASHEIESLAEKARNGSR